MSPPLSILGYKARALTQLSSFLTIESENREMGADVLTKERRSTRTFKPFTKPPSQNY